MSDSDRGPAASHWRSLVDRRRTQMDAAYARLQRTSRDYWRRRMGRGGLLRQPADPHDPLLRMLLDAATPETTVLDVGAGAGRFTRMIAPHVQRVVAIEPDSAMVELLEQGVRDDELNNVSIVKEGWIEAEVDPADLALCSHVLYPIADVVPFLSKLDQHARRRCYLALREATPEPEPLGTLWHHYHGEERYLQPGFFDAYCVLHELGIVANVQIVPTRGMMWSFDDLDHAIDALREHLILPETEEVDARLRDALQRHLVADGERMILPYRPAPSAIIWWEPAPRRAE